MSKRRWCALTAVAALLVGTSLPAQTITVHPPLSEDILPLTNANYAAPFLSDSLVNRIGLTVRCDVGTSNNCSFKLGPTGGELNLQYRLVSRTGGDCGSIPASTSWADLDAQVTLATNLPRNNPASNVCALVFDFRVRDLAYEQHTAGDPLSGLVTFTISKP